MEKLPGKPHARLDKWCLLYIGTSPRFAGTVSGHPTLPEGDEIFTSEVICIKQDGDKILEVETKNTVYTLGEFSRERQDIWRTNVVVQ